MDANTPVAEIHDRIPLIGSKRPGSVGWRRGESRRIYPRFYLVSLFDLTDSAANIAAASAGSTTILTVADWNAHHRFPATAATSAT
jgi:hypothetical protein